MKDFSFKKPVFCCLSLLVLFGVIVLLQATGVSSNARMRYEEIIASQPKKARKDRLKQKHELTKQIRWDVQKTMWISEGPFRRMLDLYAKRSEVTMFAKHNSLHFVETFYNASGIVQQELFYKDSNANEYVVAKDGTLKVRGKTESLPVLFDISQLIPMQCFRYFEAEKAIYDFDAESLLAMDTKFWTYIIEGHDLCKNTKGLVPAAIGRASSMTLPRKNSEREFYAENLRLQIKNERGIW